MHELDKNTSPKGLLLFPYPHPIYFSNVAVSTLLDRIHRIGQTREVNIHRFVMKNSLEERIVSLQEAKSAQATGVMRKLNAQEARKARLHDLQGLLLIDESKK